MATSHPVRWLIESLGKHHDRSQFKYGEDSLDHFLQKLASQHRKRDLGRTYAAVAPANNRVLGYYTIAAGSVTFNLLPDPEKRGLPEHIAIPVMHLGRLAVDQPAQAQGLGAYLLIDALHRGHQIAQSLGMRAVEVVAISEKARQFYSKHGFVELHDDPKHLYIPFKTVAKLFPNDPSECE